METSREILHFLHYHPLSSREDIRLGINFQGSDATLKRLIAAAIDTGDIIVEERRARHAIPYQAVRTF